MERANCFCYSMDRLQTGWTGKEGEENHKALEKSAVERQNETLSRVKKPVFVFQYRICGSLQPLLLSKIKFIFILLTELSFNGSTGDSPQNRFPMESVLSGTVCGMSPDNLFSLP